MLQRAWALTYLCTGSARASGVDTVKCPTLFLCLKMKVVFISTQNIQF